MATSWDSSAALAESLVGCSVVVPATAGEATRDGFTLGSLFAVSFALRRRSSSSLAALSCSAFANAAFWNGGASETRIEGKKEEGGVQGEFR